MNGRIKNLIGMRFGKLVVKQCVGRMYGGALWECQCECGRIVNVRASMLTCGDKKSCGGHGPCHHHWKGGHKNSGSYAWANKKLMALRMKAIEFRHAVPVSSAEDVMALWEQADWHCQACHKQIKKVSQFCLDHDHKTGIVRGFICHSCNTAIGYCRDSPKRLRKCARYLERVREREGQMF